MSKSTYIPHSYARSQNTWIDNFYASNGYLEVLFFWGVLKIDAHGSGSVSFSRIGSKLELDPNLHFLRGLDPHFPCLNLIHNLKMLKTKESKESPEMKKREREKHRER